MGLFDVSHGYDVTVSDKETMKRLRTLQRGYTLALH
jgi:hypothetical protein